MTILGCDPGKKGFICLYCASCTPRFIPLPFKDDRLDVLSIARDLGTAKIGAAYIEALHRPPTAKIRQRYGSLAKLGETANMLVALMDVLGVKVVRVNARTWKAAMLKGFGWQTKGDRKNKTAVDRVLLEFPKLDLRKNERALTPSVDKAESLLIAMYGHRLETMTEKGSYQ